MAEERKANIEGLGEEWEQAGEVRKMLRSSGSIFKPTAPGETVSINVKTASVNVDTLLPLLQRLADEDGNVHMVTIPDLEAEPLGFVHL